jgi:hypothetical protein
VIPNWAPAKVAISVALLCEEAQTVQAVQGKPLDGEQFCALVQDVCAVVQDYMCEDTRYRLLIAHIEV